MYFNEFDENSSFFGQVFVFISFEFHVLGCQAYMVVG